MDRTTKILILCFVLLKLVLHLIADFNSGFQGDEFLHIACGDHLAFGYMEFPPVIGWLAYIQNLFNSSGVFIHHLFVHLASTLILIFGVKILLLLGGNRRAVLLFLICMLCAPAFGRSHQLFQPVVFSQLFWILGYYQCVRFIKFKNVKYFQYLILVCGFGFLVKYDIAFFMVGLVALLFFSSYRELIWNKKLGLWILLFLLIISPNIWWQYQNNFPVVMHFSELYASKLNDNNVINTVVDWFWSLNPLLFLIWSGGFMYMFSNKRKAFKVLGIIISISFLVLFIAKGHFYYFFPMMIMAFIYGSTWLGEYSIKWPSWIYKSVVSLVLISGGLLTPFSIAVIPLDAFIKYAGIKEENERYKIPNREYYSKILWQDTLEGLKETYEELTESEKKNCLIWGKHYREAGMVNLYHKSMGLPNAFSYHGSFYSWAPESGEMPATVIAFNDDEGGGSDFWNSFFGEVIEKKRIRDNYAEDDENLWEVIYICREPKYNFSELKEIFKNRIFE